MGPNWQEALGSILAELGVDRGTLGIEDDFLPLSRVRQLQALAPHATFADASALVQKARLIKDAEPGSDHQLAFARALIQAADSGAVADLLKAWLNGEEAPAGLAIDTDLRWLIVTNLARLGVFGEAAPAERDVEQHGVKQPAGKAVAPSPRRERNPRQHGERPGEQAGNAAHGDRAAIQRRLDRVGELAEANQRMPAAHFAKQAVEHDARERGQRQVK